METLEVDKKQYKETLYLTVKNYEKLKKYTKDSTSIKLNVIESNHQFVDCEVSCRKASEIIIRLLSSLK